MRILLGSIAMIGHGDEAGITSPDYVVFKTRSGVLNHLWFYHWLRSPWGERFIRSLTRGAVRERLLFRRLAAAEIDLPPWDLQQRFEHESVLIARARHALQEQLQAAAALPAACLHEVFNSAQAKAWPRKRLGEVLRLRKEIIHPHDAPKGPAIFVGLEHIEPNTGCRIGSVDVEMSHLAGRKPQFRNGDIVYGYLRPYLNKLWIADFDGLCSVDQFAFAVDHQAALTGFVAWFMRSPVYLERSRINTTTGQLPRIGTGEVAGVEFGCPSLETQRKVLGGIDSTMSEVRGLRRGLESQFAALDHLPTTLLRQAFSGEL